MAAVYTQIAAKQDRMTCKGLDNAIDGFLRSAGTFKYICENFTNAPSMDLNSEMLEMLGQLMSVSRTRGFFSPDADVAHRFSSFQAQAKECLLEKLELESDEKKSVDARLELAQEAGHVAECYKNVKKFVSPVKDYVPYSWMSLVSVKAEYYTALSHRHLGMALIKADLKDLSDPTLDTLKHMHREPDSKIQLDIRVPKDDEERFLLGRAHLRESLLRFEESQRLHRMCRELKNKPGLEAALKKMYSSTFEAYTDTENENDFRDLLEPPQILRKKIFSTLRLSNAMKRRENFLVSALTKFQLTITPPDFAEYRVEDMFKKLGPCAIFSAKHHWTAPRLIQLQRTDRKEGFGFTVRGSCPVIVAGVDPNSLADVIQIFKRKKLCSFSFSACFFHFFQFGGMKEGDYIVAIGDSDVKWCTHEAAVELIKAAGDALTLKLVTPMDKNYSKVP